MSWQQDLARERCDYLKRLAGAGSGWHPYALDQADKLAKAEPDLHAGTAGEIETAIGPNATVAARKALEWFSGKGAA